MRIQKPSLATLLEGHVLCDLLTVSLRPPGLSCSFPPRPAHQGNDCWAVQTVGWLGWFSLGTPDYQNTTGRVVMAIINGVEKTFQEASRPYQENLCPQGYRSEFLADHIP